MLTIRCYGLPLAPGLILALLGTLGCTPPAPTEQATFTAPTTTSDSNLQQELDQALDFTLQHRRLNSAEHGAWQILHGVLAYKDAFPVQVGQGGPVESAVAYATGGGEIRGWTFQPGDVLDPASGRRGLRALVEPGTRKGQGHADQWLAILAQADLQRDQVLKVDGQSYTMDQFVQQVQRDIPYNAQREWSWSLVGLTHYLTTDTQWTAADGETWSIERMVQAEAEQEIDASACGGTHRLIGLASALNRRRAEGRPLTGPWQTADQLVQDGIRRTLEFQNPDGSFSSQYFRRPASSPDLAIVLGTTGHMLEFLAIAMTDEQLQQPQVQLAARQLCAMFRDTQNLPLECGALYHAAHGLVIYRQRMFGPRTYEAETDQTGDTALRLRPSLSKWH